MQQQQQQQQQPQVIVVQQPVIIDESRRRGPAPFIQRGVQFNNGCRCTGCLLILLCISGVVVTYISSLILFIADSKSILAIITTIFGVLMMATCCRLCYVARRDFNALPPDHPDRTKYSNHPAIPLQPTTTTYQLPPGAQVVTYPPDSSEGQVPGNPLVLSGGQVPGYPITPTRHSQDFTPSAPTVAVGYRTDDLPPAYEDVAKNVV